MIVIRIAFTEFPKINLRVKSKLTSRLEEESEPDIM